MDKVCNGCKNPDGSTYPGGRTRRVRFVASLSFLRFEKVHLCSDCLHQVNGVINQAVHLLEKIEKGDYGKRSHVYMKVEAVNGLKAASAPADLSGFADGVREGTSPTPE